MELQFLAELLDVDKKKKEQPKEEAPSRDDEIKVEGKEYIEQIARLLFVTAFPGPVKDAKRSKEAKFWGIAHTKSKLVGADGKNIHLTFDNSTDSGEFEINSLVPLMIERGSTEDMKIISLYRKLDIPSKKRTNYIAHGDKILLREIHLGKEISENTVRFMKQALKVLKQTSDVDDEAKPVDKNEPPVVVDKESKPKAKKKDK